MSNIIRRPEFARSVRTIEGTSKEIGPMLSKIAKGATVKADLCPVTGNIHIRGIKKDPELGELQIHYVVKGDGSDKLRPTPWTVYTANGSEEVTSLDEALWSVRGDIHEGLTHWATIVGPDGKEVHYRSNKQRSVLRVLNALGGNPEYKVISQALNDLQGL